MYPNLYLMLHQIQVLNGTTGTFAENAEMRRIHNAVRLSMALRVLCLAQLLTGGL